ncbi:MAG: hypothetical protein OER43_14015 [Gammaproteobacteria bacterium]|nr:hypothetical protein [Gammaproteobacteria bacterium]MDH3411994.1 hypothetical protein [Gammaproteobacteria bacterium]
MRERLSLRRKGQISEVDRIFAAVVTAKDVDCRGVNRDVHQGLDSGTAADPESSELIAHQFDPGYLLSDPVPVFTLSQSAPSESNLEKRLDFNILRGGEARGVALWIDPDPAGGIRVENAPGTEASRKIMQSRRRVLFFWPAIVQLIPGDNVRVDLRTKHLGEEHDWYWDSLIRTAAGGKIQGIRYQQSTASPLTVLNGKRE